MIMRDSMPGLMTVIGYIVAALFVVFGIYVLMMPELAGTLPKEFRTIFGVTIIGYGIFRLVIIYQKSKRRNDSDDETDN